MKIYETINNIRVEVIKDDTLDGSFPCNSCCFEHDLESCDMSACNNRRDVHFKFVYEEEVVPTQKFETINGVCVEVIHDTSYTNCTNCCFKNDKKSCDLATCYTEDRNVYFKRSEDEIVPEGTVEKYDDDFVKHLHEGVEYYRGVCHSVGNLLGISAYTSDDGSIQDSVLSAKLEEMVAELVLENVKLKSKIRSLEVLGK